MVHPYILAHLNYIISVCLSPSKTVRNVKGIEKANENNVK